MDLNDYPKSVVESAIKVSEMFRTLYCNPEIFSGKMTDEEIVIALLNEYGISKKDKMWDYVSGDSLLGIKEIMEVCEFFEIHPGIFTKFRVLCLKVPQKYRIQEDSGDDDDLPPTNPIGAFIHKNYF